MLTTFVNKQENKRNIANTGLLYQRGLCYYLVEVSDLVKKERRDINWNWELLKFVF